MALWARHHCLRRDWSQEKSEANFEILGPQSYHNSGHQALPRKLIKEENRLTFSGSLLCSRAAEIVEVAAYRICGL